MNSATHREDPLTALLPWVRELTILVVDDDELVRDSTRLLLEEAGARVLIARYGAEALEALATHSPDLILSDLLMPRMDGYQLVERIRSDPARADVPIIALSATASPTDQERIRRAGFDGHVVKPFDYATLAEGFKKAMRRLRTLYRRQCERLRILANQQRREAVRLRERSLFVRRKRGLPSGSPPPGSSTPD
jgi:two-component system chemotaxis response regulator CheY